MFSYQDKIKAIKLYYKFNKHYAPTIQKLGYPAIQTLKNWIKEYESNGSVHKSYDRNKRPRFTRDQINKAISYYYEHGENLTDTVNNLGYPCCYTLQKWLLKYSKKYKPKKVKLYSGNYSDHDKCEAAIELCTTSKTVNEVAKEYNVTRASLNNWKGKHIGKGNEHSMAKKKLKETNTIQNLETKKELRDQISKLKAEAVNLHKEVDQLRLEKDVLEKAAELIKKDQGINIDDLTNKDKTIIIDALRDKYKLSKLLKVLKIAKSSYCYNHIALLKEDKYKGIRSTIIDVFSDSKKTYGYRRVHAELIKKSIILSEKVIRRIMKEENLVVFVPKMKKYSSYQGEITPAVKNLLKRDFHADSPYEKLLTDITEFHIPAGKVYLSPMIDCFDGLPLNWCWSRAKRPPRRSEIKGQF